MVVSRDPALIWNPLSEAESQPTIVPVQVIVHTAVDAPGPTNLAGYFENRTNLESHTWLRWDRHEQMMSFLRRADANYKANRWFNSTLKRYEGALSIETEDDGDPVGKPWNTYQLDELVRFIVWACRTYNIPPVLCTGPYEPGLGYHVLFPGVWSNAVGKTCPGSTRIQQFINIVIPRVQGVLKGDINQEEFTVAQFEEIKAQLDRIEKGVLLTAQSVFNIDADLPENIEAELDELRINVRAVSEAAGVPADEIRR